MNSSLTKEPRRAASRRISIGAHRSAARRDQADPPGAAEPEEATFPRWRGLETLSQYASYVLRPMYSIAPGLCRLRPFRDPCATRIQMNSYRKGQISPLTVDTVTRPVGVDFHAASTDSIAGPPASVRPRYTHHRPRPHRCCGASWSIRGGLARSVSERPRRRRGRIFRMR